MQFFTQLIKRFRALKTESSTALRTFSSREWMVFSFAGVLLIISAIGMLYKLNKLFVVTVPISGGTLKEGIVGTPRFINPILAISDADKDLTGLVYSGLMKHDNTGRLVTDLAESYTISKNGLVYTFIIREDATFHDGEQITADDVVFTVTKTKDPLQKSPKKINWEGVEAQKVDDRTVTFLLKKPYASFLDSVTLGILPMHVWKNLNAEEFTFSELNTDPIGSGPYEVRSVKKVSGIARTYTLKSFSDYAGGEPYIRTIEITSFANIQTMVDAFESGELDQISGIDSATAKQLEENDSSVHIRTAVLPRVFGIFFNQNQNTIFTDKAVIEAFQLAIDKQAIINEVLKGYGVTLESPIPPQLLADTDETLSSDSTDIPNNYSLEKARLILEKNGWTKNSDGVFEKIQKTGTGKTQKTEKKQLVFSLATGDAPELKDSALLIKKYLEALGATVTLDVYDLATLNQSVIRPRSYDALFFGQIISNEADLYAFWHSSQRNDPGLNIAMYTNTKADTLLESALATTDSTERTKKYLQFQTIVEKDMPAIFIYAPLFTYVTREHIKGIVLDRVTSASDRFITIPSWYIETDNIWKIFTQ
ncbi:ABC transporter substrate-binding protein [Candidatus Nomurabacteria bacterium]|nr:ABC transporter substrate-binding protein [Candidatus Nomurabacteria bacterium]